MAACDSLFTPRPLGPLLDIADQWPTERRARLFADRDRMAVFSAFLRELAEQPVIIVFDDVHWADEATLDLLRYVGRRVQRTRALMLVTYRNDELGAPHPLRAGLDSPSGRRLEKGRFGGLTECEREVAALIALGRSNREIAAALTVGVKTVETYVTRILTKLGFDSRVQIATWAVEQGLDPRSSSTSR